MLYIFGDSHGRLSFHNLPGNPINLSQNAITMFRVGRDGIIPNFKQEFVGPNSIFAFAYGEVDCRCHVARQLAAGRIEEEICRELVDNYITAIQKNIPVTQAIVICSVIPPTRRDDYESIHGPIRHEFPFIGTDAERVRYTAKVNHLLQEACEREGFLYFDGYEPYRRPDGTLRYELSDKLVHVANVQAFQESFVAILDTINSRK